METALVRKIRGMGIRTKIGITVMLVLACFLYQAMFRPLIGDTATNTYYFTLDSAAVNLGADGYTTTRTSRDGKISMKPGVYTTSRYVTASVSTAEQNMIRAYGPVYATKQTLTAPSVTIGMRDRNGTTNNMYWKAYVYAYNPKGTANNGVLLWTSDEKEAHPAVQTPLELTFTNPQPKDVEAGYRLKVVVTCRMASTSSSARFYWGNSTNYSYFTVTEAPYVANSVTVNNLSDYYSGQLASVTQGDGAIPMLKMDLYSNVSGGATWSGGKLDKIGTNTSVYVNEDEPGDVTFSIFKDANGDGLFQKTDTQVGGPYTFTQFTGQAYELATPQTITTTPQRYFIVYSIARNSTYGTTVGARVANSSYFAVTGAAGGVVNVTSTSSSTPTIQYGGTAVTKIYAADWDEGTTLAGISETGGPSATDTACITSNTTGSGFPLVGLLNYPSHTCASVAGRGYSATTAQPDFIRLYFAGAGYHSVMKTIKGGSFVYRVYTPFGGGTVTLQLFYVTSDGVRVNAPITSRYTTGSSISQTITTSLAGQDFSNVPAGARLGIQIGVTAGMRIGLGSSVNAQLMVQETAAENENVDVGNGSAIPNATVYASDVNKVIDSFTLTAAKAKTVTAVTIKGNATFTGTNIKEVKLYADTGTIGTLDGSDTLLGSTATISGNTATISGLNLAISTAVRRYLVVVNIGDAPNTNVILTAVVDDLTVASTGGIGVDNDSTSATLTILPTTTLSDFIAAEPPNAIIPWNAGPTKVDAFGLRTNGGVNDTIRNVTVTLSTTSGLPAGKVISDYVGRVDIVTAAGTSLGHLTAPTMADNWQVPTTGLAATQIPTDYYVAITPKGNQGITFTVKGRVTSVTHSRTTNALLVNDAGSATILMDEEPPNESSLTAVTGTYHNDTDRAEVNLSWLGTTDAGGQPVTYKLVRGLGNAPAPRTCTVDNAKTFLAYQGPATSVVDKGLDEGVNYGYRLCVIDSVNNINAGVTASATAAIKNRCNELPELIVNPTASYVKAGTTVKLTIGIKNKDTGVCGPTTFSLVTHGTNIDDSNFTVAAFEANDFAIPTNNGSKYTHLDITAKPGAIEGAVKTFHVKVVKSSGGETMCPDPIEVVVNKYGTMMHSSLQLGTQKYGKWGVNFTCSTCHSPDATNIKQVRNVITTPTGPRPVLFDTISTAINANVAGVFGNDRRSGTASTNVCEVCHHRARFHQYSAAKVAWKDHNNNGDCLKCHPHSIGFKTKATGQSCDDCHGNPPTSYEMLVVPPTEVLFPFASNAGSHGKHNARQVTCTACHSNANHLVTATPDMQLNLGFSVTNGTFPGFVGSVTTGTIRTLAPGNDYSWSGAAGTTIQQAPNTIMTCSVYCHGWEGNGGYNTEPAWTGITQVGCGSCHAATADVPPPSGSHAKHAGNEPGYGNGIACAKCHGFRNYSTSASHINGNVEWDLAANSTTARYAGVAAGSTGAKAPTAPGSYGTCSNLYCHSDVQSNNGTGGPTSFATPVWGGSTNCNSCHQADPNTTGGHPQHAGEEVTGFDCRICHANGGSTNSLNHGNSKINFMFTGLGENTHYSYSSAKTPGSAPYGTCYNGNCHGARRTLAWEPPNHAVPLCEKCHTTSPSAAGFYSTSGPGSTTSKTDPYVGAHFQHITSMPFRYSARIDCSGCHLKPTGPYTPGHIDSALPAEVIFGAIAGSGVQNGYSSAEHQPSYNYASRECSNVWCHGGGMASNVGAGPYGSAVTDGGSLGSPAPAVWNSPYLTGVGTNDCVKCHAFPPAAPLPGYTHWDDNNNRPFVANQCILCHKHVDNTGYAFKDPKLHVNGVVDSCNTCHGRPPVDEAGMTIPAVGALTPGMVGAHQAHALNPSIGKDCNVCHYQYSQEMPSYDMEMGFNAYGGRVTSGTFYGYSTLSDNYSPRIVYKSTNAGTVVRRTTNADTLNTCANLYCHGGGTSTRAALQGGSNTRPNWEGGSSQAACGTCHGVTADTYHATGSHDAHVSTAFGKPRLGCSNCHGVKENNYHVDGKVGWAFYSTAQRLNQKVANPQYTPAAGNGTAGASGATNGLAPSTAFGTCAVYCHSDGRGNYASPLPVWGGAPMNCGSCHKNQTSAFTDSHQKHSASSANGGYGIDCFICHLGSGSGNPKHVNGDIDVVFNSTVVGVTATYDSGAKKCFSILCHDTTAAAGPTWGVPSTGTYDGGTHKPTCIGCHSGEVGTRAAVIPQFGGESHHVQGVQISNTVCYQCHWEANANGTANIAYHTRTAGQPVNLVIRTTTSRPVTYTEGSTGTAYTSNGTRTELAKVNSNCLGCHNATNAASQPFGDGMTPTQYAWDGKSIAERYSVATTTTWAKVTGNNTVAKSLTKAYSAHGRADLNQRGWTVGNSTTGEVYANTSGTVNVLCYDCHNSHGTSATGIMSSYSSATGRNMGGILKATSNGIGGYTADYTPYAGGDAAEPNKNAYNPGAALCFDCHNTASAGATAPWGYGPTASGGTFGSTQAIYGYHDTPYFGSGTFANTQTYAYKALNPDNKGGHFGASSSLTTTAAKPINGLCTPCHDPHGVSPSLGANQAYAVPLLKGTWVTSPYKQDAAPASKTEARGGGKKRSAMNVGSTPGYRIDQNSMGIAAAATRSQWTFPGTPTTLQPRTEAEFAGLCIGCHAKADLNNTAAPATSNWKTMRRVHNTVKGWATASGGNANNKVHAFTCSKCHTPHNAKLPRLLVTNCLDVKHRGRAASGGSMTGPASQSGSQGAGVGRFPQGGGGTGDQPSGTNAGKWFFGNATQSTSITINSQTLCHQSATAGGSTYSQDGQLWNTKSPW
ncbi:CxxxxCH/CxxCH domain-containing protein [Geobacter sulfurreducens]|uniref:CxxxxCH/CxxCH domain c-type cytochrome n=1 Tax=Geobacter sulfurreducens TaxID=35554 RepID=UPI001BDC1D15|nr:CxxxxCH/CxxCH domain-containing protein [Geobacter sulfurreducens]QVW34712.1 CxxxxCH/CxxCH domain-containing protein [Geobacter sulfurreducens]